MQRFSRPVEIHSSIRMHMHAHHLSQLDAVTLFESPYFSTVIPVVPFQATVALIIFTTIASLIHVCTSYLHCLTLSHTHPFPTLSLTNLTWSPRWSIKCGYVRRCPILPASPRRRQGPTQKRYWCARWKLISCRPKWTKLSAMYVLCACAAGRVCIYLPLVL